MKISKTGVDLLKLLKALEKDLIAQALSMTRGDKAKAAKLLHIKRTTLVEKSRKFGFIGEKINHTEAREFTFGQVTKYLDREQFLWPL